MPGRKIVDMDSLFSGAEQVHKLSEAEAEIKQLKEEIEQLRFKGSAEIEKQVENLRDRLKSESGTLLISLDDIRPNSEQPRQTFSAESVQTMANSLKQDGQLAPIILIQEEDYYFLFDGERRWRGANLIGWSTLEAVLISKPKALHRQALLTSLHREDLNSLDKAEALIREISETTRLVSEDIPRILSAVSRRLTKQGKLNQLSQAVSASLNEQKAILDALDVSEQERSIIAVLLTLQLNPSSVDANIFPMLSLAPDLKVAIREQGLKGSHAMVLQQLSAKNLNTSQKEADQLRKKTITRVIQENFSVSQTRKLIREILKQHKVPSQAKFSPAKVVNSFNKTVQGLSEDLLGEMETSRLEDLRKILKDKLKDVEAALEQR
ncbi:MAG: ParB/RepB/Spo0J family partition protein [Leptolyngbyaceae cyanobacterium MO_188.B28]|nr:ParB/RepB/Spo0J family partition protein [Leptolyngbyaceae cyanobacterium MO_188.B28]